MSEMKKDIKGTLPTGATALLGKKYIFILVCGLFAAFLYAFLTFLNRQMSQETWGLFITVFLAALLLLIFGAWGHKMKSKE